MLNIQDYFNIPKLNEYRNQYLIQNQEFFWFISKKNVLCTELGDITEDENNNYIIGKIEKQDPYDCVTKEDFENKIIDNWGITNNNEKNYYDLKINNKGVFYTTLNNKITEYKIIFKYKTNDDLRTFELNGDPSLDFKINSFSLYKNGHAVLKSLNTATSLSLDGFIVGYNGRLKIDDENYINMEINATILNEKKYTHPNFEIKVNSNIDIFIAVSLNSEVEYIQKKPESYEIQKVLKNTNLNYEFSPK